MTNAVAGTALEIVGAGTRTASLVKITDTPDSGATALDIDVTSTDGCTTAAIDIDVAGTDDADVISIDFSAAYTGDAIGVTMANAAATSQALVIDTDVAHSGNIVDISCSGALAGGTGKLCVLSVSGTPAAATSGFVLDVVDTDGTGQATSYAMRITSTNNEALHVDAGKALFDEEVGILAGQKLSLDGTTGGSYIYENSGVLTAFSDGNIQLTPASGGNGQVIIGDLTTAGESELHIKGDDDGDNDAGFLVMYDDDGNDYYLWVDSTGDLRIHTAKPADTDADGAVVGDQAA
jgi:hypothetical protein